MFLNAPAKLLVLRRGQAAGQLGHHLQRLGACSTAAADVTLYEVACWLSAVIPSLPRGETAGVDRRRW